MPWLTEDPTTVLVIGGLVLLVLAVMLAKSGRAVLMIAMAVVALLVGACVLVERLVVTQREEVEMALQAIAEAFAVNDEQAVLKHIASSAGPVSRNARRVLKLVEVHKADITDGPHVTINELTEPVSATAEVTVVGEGTLKSNGIRSHYPTKLVINLDKENDQWVITDYEGDLPYGLKR